MPRKSWWARLPFGVRMAAGAGAVLVVVGAGAAGVATVVGSGGKPGPRIVTEANQAVPAAPAPLPVRVGKPHNDKPRSIPKNQEKASDAVRRAATTTPGATPSPSVPGPAAPQQKTQTQIETRAIPYETRLVHDPALPRGAKKVETPGVDGVETLRYLVTLTDGRPTDRKLIDAVVTRQPQHQVVALGTQSPAPGTRRPAHNCGEALNFCVPLGRKAACPHQGREEDASIPLPDLVLNSDGLGYLEGLAC